MGVPHPPLGSPSAFRVELDGFRWGRTMIKDGVMICDNCGTTITRVLDVPPDGWPKLHAVCSPCFAKLAEKKD